MFKKLLTYSEIREKSSKAFVVDGLPVAVFKLDGKIYAIKNACPHQHFALLHEGEIGEGAVTCPMHGWMFDLETGLSRTGQGRVTIYPVKIMGNDILVDVDV